MVTEKIIITDEEYSYTTVIGRVGEHGVLAKEFDLTKYKELYGTGTASLTFTPPGGTEILINTSATDKGIKWIIGTDATNKKGTGVARLHYTVTNGLKKSCDILCVVLEGGSSSADPDDNEYKSWIESATELVESLEEYAEDVEQIKENLSDKISSIELDGNKLKAKKSDGTVKNEVTLPTSTGYQKPSTGIPESDLSEDVKTKLNSSSAASVDKTKFSMTFSETGTLTLLYDGETVASTNVYAVTAPDDWNGSGSTTPDTPVTPTKTLSSISVTYNGGNADVIAGSNTSSLDITVTAHYSDNTTETITGYTLSPLSVSAGINTITVTYNGKTATFTVTGKSASSETTMTSISAVFNDTSAEIYTSASDLDITVTAHYSDGSTAQINNYSISGEVAEGENTFTIVYGSLSTTVSVLGVESVLEDTKPHYAGALNDGRNVVGDIYGIAIQGTQGSRKYVLGSSSVSAMSNFYKVAPGETYALTCEKAGPWNNAPKAVANNSFLFFDKTPKWITEIDGRINFYESGVGKLENLGSETDLAGTKINVTVTVPDGCTRMAVLIKDIYTSSTVGNTYAEAYEYYGSGLILTKGGAE